MHFSFKTLRNKKRHQETHKGNKPYTCLKCSTKFQNSDDLKEHNKLVHKNENYEQNEETTTDSLIEEGKESLTTMLKDENDEDNLNIKLEYSING